MINLHLEVIFGAFLTLVVSVLGFLGKSFVDSFKESIKEYKKEIEELAEKVSQNNETLIRIATAYEETSKHVDDLTARMNDIEKEIVRQERDNKSLFNAVKELKHSPKSQTIY